MNLVAADQSRSRLYFSGFLLIWVIVYGVYLFSFTLFEGFSTISSDSFGYILLARKWSLYYPPSLAETLTWPVHTYPPGLAWLLAITGASESTWMGHLAVSLSMLLSLVLIGWLACRELGWAIGGLLTISLSLLPGAVFSSMSILSENPYLALTLAVLLLYSIIREKDSCSPVWFIALGLCLSLAILTRTSGIALIAALMVVSLFDSSLPRNRRMLFLFTALLSVCAWQLWGLLDPQSKESSYLTFLAPALGHESMALVDRISNYLGSMLVNVQAMLSGWVNYISPGVTNLFLLLFSYALLGFCIVATLIRASALKLDAIYILFYLGILVLWPYPAEMLRFLHPVMMLLLIQPVFFVHAQTESQALPALKLLNVSFIVLLLINSLIFQNHFIELKNAARKDHPTIVHAREYYAVPDRNEAIHKASTFQDILRVMASTADIIPESSKVASDQHATLTVLADRAAVNLSSIVPPLQQLCNVKTAEVEFVFISGLTNSYNPMGIKLFDSYDNIASFNWSIKDSSGNPRAYVLQMDREKIDSILSETGYECVRFQDRPLP